VVCLPCHIAQDTLWRSSTHGTRPGQDPNARCQACHGSHRPPIAGFLHTADGRDAMRRACEACHTEAVQTSTVGVHADSVSCVDCHGIHDIRPVRDAATHGVDVAVSRNCSRCHREQAETYWRDVHGRTAAGQAAGIRDMEPDTAATCINCHGEHGIHRHDDPTWRLAVADRCAACHPRYGSTYRDSYHGQATKVGSLKAAECHDCHSAHNVLPESDSASAVAPANRTATCRGCHEEANDRFAGYRPHANPHDRAQNPLLFWIWLFMNVLLFGTIIVWGAHAGIWFFRNWQERRKRMAAFEAVHGHRAPMDSALRGGPPYVWRFNTIFRVIHAMIIVTFFLLVITGLPLRFSCAPWAPGLMGLLGGAEQAGTIHRYTGMTMFGYFLLYVVYIAVRVKRTKDRLGLVYGTDTILFRWQDAKDALAMMKYFFGKGPHPRFGRYSYMEKFDYFAELWGVFAIGTTGLMLWFPELFAQVFPGILFNIAIIIHSYEAMIATAFIFTIHFFNVHLRPEKWPIDAVMFTGRMSLASLEEEHPLVAERIEHHVRTAPVTLKATIDEPAPPPSRWMNIAGPITGMILLALGIVLIGLILWGSLC
jgi:cytochrome b subunit of formate dehydrogenase